MLFVEEEDEKPVFEKKDMNWEEDMEMYSKFLNRKVNAPDLCIIKLISTFR